MKISTKILISTVLAMTISFSIAGYALLSSFFQSGYEQAVDVSLNTNRLIMYSVTNYLRGSVNHSDSITKKDVKDSIEAVAGMFLKENMGMQVYDMDGERLYSSIDINDNQEIREGVSETRTAYFSMEFQGRQYIQVISRMRVGAETIYIATYQNITYLYETREKQLVIYNRILLILFVVYGIISFLLASFIVRPIRRISRTASRIADGNLEYRIHFYSEDEIGALAYNFNRMAENLSGKIAELEDAARRQEEFVGNFTHELKTPLTSIIGYADLMRSDETISEMNLMCANYIFQEGKRLESLSFRLLDLIVLKKQDLRLKNVGIIGLFKSIHASMLPILVKEHIEFTLKAEKGRILAEPELMKTVIMNLIDNARKAITGKGEIALTGRREEESYVITVRDNGKGIPQSQIDKITEAFYMVDKSRSREQGGAGLGLAICAQIVMLHEGALSFESEEGKWTKVTLRLKLGENL